MENNFITIPELALKLGISRIAVFKKVKNGKIQAIRIGRTWAIPVDKDGTYKQHINKKDLSTEFIGEKVKDINKRGGFVDKNVNNSEKSQYIEKETEMEEMGWD